MFRYFSFLSTKSFESSVVIKDSYFRNFSQRFVVIFSRRRGKCGLGCRLLGTQKLFHEACLNGKSARLMRSGSRTFSTRHPLTRARGIRQKHFAFAVEQPTHVHLRETFVDVVDCGKTRISSSAKNTRERTLGYAYLGSENFLRHSHAFHESNDTILHDFMYTCLFITAVCCSKSTAKIRNLIQTSKLYLCELHFLLLLLIRKLKLYKTKFSVCIHILLFVKPRYLSQNQVKVKHFSKIL